MLSVAASPSGFGASISGADVARLDNSEFNCIHRALADHAVLAIGGQAMNAAEFTAFAGRFGTPQPAEPAKLRHPRQPEILVAGGAGDGAEGSVNALYALKISAGDCSVEFLNERTEDRFHHQLRAGDILIWDTRRASRRAADRRDAGHTLYRIAVAEHV
jgi:alpha-ketoglutarate-dependent taurine dioxygenase